ncbi:hypothetical protein OIU77_018819 [Salix suchowensis]|uniref:Coenzyme Q-binding protein COQ10 START domain-containing protein n=1 Tax=Salix suchowensis TaxID=1278906 RepID=A0ABQ9CHP2_9ROSI|nr:hypothetical protein OIU77_018819 [Salix suchowensis]
MTASTSPGMVLDGAFREKDKLSTEDLKQSYPSSTFGPMLPPSNDLNNNWGVLGKACRLDRRCMVDEVHLRRFDGLLENGGVHRCVFASITVKAPVREVWNVLTAYESLPEFVPNLAISKILSRENNKVRILQEGCKGLLYMVLHARVVLDLCEHLEQEISFEQVEGDFDSFQGKWILEQLGSHHTLLKYNVESKMHRDTFLSEAIMEEVIYEDLPSNLCAIRDYIEKREPNNSVGHRRTWTIFKGIGFIQRKRLVDSKGVGEWTLSFMPRRYDIARALEKWGGLHEVSRLLALKVRHPNRQANFIKDRKIDNAASSTHAEGEDKSPTKS